MDCHHIIFHIALTYCIYIYINRRTVGSMDRYIDTSVLPPKNTNNNIINEHNTNKINVDFFQLPVPCKTTRLKPSTARGSAGKP